MMDAEKSIALRYSEGLPAPFVIAKGKGELASKLVKLAEECGLPVVPAGTLAESLFFLEVGEFIPEPFYRAVAEALAFIWQADVIAADDIKSRKNHGIKTDQSK